MKTPAGAIEPHTVRSIIRGGGARKRTPRRAHRNIWGRPVSRSSALSVVARWITAINAGDLPAFLSAFEDECVLVEPQHTYVGKSDVSRWFETVVVHRSSSLRILSAHDAEPDHVLVWAEWATRSFYDEVTVWTPLAVLTGERRIREIHISPPVRVPAATPAPPDEENAG